MADGFFSKLRDGLFRSRQNLNGMVDDAVTEHQTVDDDFFDGLTDALILSDMGAVGAEEAVSRLRERVKAENIREPARCKEILKEILVSLLDVPKTPLKWPMVILMVGVNGVGKTTTVGKLAGILKGEGKKVILAAADTFRAAAIEQLTAWANRTGTEIIAQGEGSDPAAVIFDAVAAAKARNADVLLCDTAGRLHNKKNLMQELAKIDRVIQREYPDCYRENLLVLDGTTGQNALSQLREFSDIMDITGIVLTKMDGTARGGIAVAIQTEFGIPVKYIGVGEQVEDLQKFDSDSYVRALFARDDETQQDSQNEEDEES